jgi:hypothetical protein
MVVRSSLRGNAAAAKSRCLSQVKKRYVTSALARGRGEVPVARSHGAKSWHRSIPANIITKARKIVMNHKKILMMLALPR